MIQLIEKSQMEDYQEYFTKNAVEYMKGNQTTAFEGFLEYNLLSFDWYNVEEKGVWIAPIMIYQDKAHLFFTL